MRPLAWSVLIAGALLAPARPVAAPEPPPFLIALVRDDGVMLPMRRTIVGDGVRRGRRLRKKPRCQFESRTAPGPGGDRE
jgi:hypothetical protein